MELYFDGFDRFDVGGDSWFGDIYGLSRGMTLEFALEKYNEKNYNNWNVYDFSISLNWWKL